MKKVSIVLPVYNGEKYIEEAICSVINQTYENWELIIVNDCSTDNTKKIIEQYKNVEPRIKIIDNMENQKLPRSLNIGFENANGEYYTWTSDDNRYKEDAIEMMVKCLEENSEYGMVYCDSYIINEVGEVVEKVSRDIEELYYNNCIGACFMYRRSVAETTGIYNPEMFLVEDYDYWLRINKQFLIYHCMKCEYYYRKHDRSLSATRYSDIRKSLYQLRTRELDFILSQIGEQEKEYLFLDMYFCKKNEKEKLKKKFWSNGKLPKNIQWIERNKGNISLASQSIVIFGAGEYGQRALQHVGRENVKCFLDNNKELQGKKIEGKEVFSMAQIKSAQEEILVLVAVDARKVGALVKQLEENSITRYLTYLELIGE